MFIPTTTLTQGSALGARVTHSTTQSLTDGAWTPLTFDTETRDDANFHDNVNPTRLTAPSSGWYDISGFVEFAANHVGSRGLRIRLDGAGSGIGRTFYDETPQAAVPDVFQISISLSYYLNAAQYVELEAFQSSGGGLNASGSALNPFSMVLY